MKKFNIAYIFILALFITSCEDNLNLNPSQSLSEEEALQDINGMTAALNGAYDGLQSINHYGREFLVIPDIEADLAYLTINNSNRFVTTYTYQFTPFDGDVTAFWNQAYNTILKANAIINNIDGIEGDQATKDALKGEALAIRALCHFDLVRFFARPYTQSNPSTDLGVPVVLVSEIAEPPRDNIETVYNQVIADLTAASGMVSDNGTFRFNGDAVQALLARVLLYKGDNSGAASAANAVINSGNYAIETDIVAAFQAPGSKEEIFTLRFQTAEDRGADNFGQIYNPSGYGDVRVAQDLINLYEGNDTRRAFIVQNTDGNFYQQKYLEQEGILGLHSPKLLRISEMYLIAAEAEVKNGNVGAAATLLNTLRNARGASSITAPTMNDIMDERARELAFEGHRSFDLWRNGMDMVRDQCNDTDQLTAPCTIAANSDLTVHPIPQRELDVNQAMVQNPGY